MVSSSANPLVLPLGPCTKKNAAQGAKGPRGVGQPLILQIPKKKQDFKYDQLKISQQHLPNFFFLQPTIPKFQWFLLPVFPKFLVNPTANPPFQPKHLACLASGSKGGRSTGMAPGKTMPLRLGFHGVSTWKGPSPKRCVS